MFTPGYFSVFTATVSVYVNLRIMFKLLVCATYCPFVQMSRAEACLNEYASHSDSQYRSGLVSVDKASVKLVSQNKRKTSVQKFQIKTPLALFSGQLWEKQSQKLIS